MTFKDLPHGSFFGNDMPGESGTNIYRKIDDHKYQLFLVTEVKKNGKKIQLEAKRKLINNDHELRPVKILYLEKS